MGADDKDSVTPYMKFMSAYGKLIDGPVTFFKENVVDRLHSDEKPYYYHRRYRRVPTVDECYTQDAVCLYEANMQFKRDKKVDGQILAILKRRRMECETYYGADAYPTFCQKAKDDYDQSEINYFMKYGDIGYHGKAQDHYMKQKHRMLWERRYGKVGTGMNKKVTVGDE